jgi:lipopolysaccharide export system protein LptC
MALAALDPHQHAFLRARRHSRRVRLLRLALPALAVAAVLAFAVLPLVRLAAVPITIAEIEPVDLTDAAITMESAKLTGFNSDRRPYEVTANTARQSLQDPLAVQLGGLAARVGLDGDRWALLQAAEGIYRTSTQLLQLVRGVQVNSSAGDNALLETAQIDLKGGRIVSDKPLTIRMGEATLAADRLDLSESGQSVVFEGRVVMVLKPKAQIAAAPQEATP